MNQRNKKRLSRQLSAQAANLETLDGSALAVAIAESCRAMLQAALPEVGTLQDGQPEAKMLYADLAMMADLTAQLLGRVQAAAGIDADDLKRQLTDTVLNTEKTRSSVTALRKELADCQQQSQEMERQVAETGAALERARSEQAEAAAEYERLQQQMAAFPPDRLDAMKKANERLAEAYNQAQQEWKAEQEQNQALQSRLDELKAAFDAQPEEKRRLLQACDEAEQRLERLKTIADQYSPEAQEKLKQQIEETASRAEENRTNCEELEKRLEDLKNEITVYDQNRETLTTDLFQRLDRSMAGLKKALEAHEQRLRQVKQQADIFRARLQECQQMRAQYADWLVADATPLDAMAAALDRPEADTLRSTLDIGSLDRVKELRGRISGDLEELDAILRNCASAAQQDRDRVNGLARR